MPAGGLREALHEGGAVAFAQRDLVVTVDEIGRHLVRIAVDVAHARLDERPRQRDLHQAIQHRDLRDPEADRDGLRPDRVAGGVNQDQRVDAAGLRQRGFPGHPPAERIAGEDAVRDAEVVEDGGHEPHVGLDRVVAVGRRAR